MGCGSLFEEVAREIESMGGKIIMNAKAVEFEANKERITSVKYIENGKKKTLQAESVVSSMPLGELVLGLVGVPDKIAPIAAGLPYRAFIIVGILVKRFGFSSKLSRESWIYVQESSVRMGRIQIWGNWSPYIVATPEDTVWIGCEYFCTEGDTFWNLPDKEIIRLAEKELASMGLYDGEILLAHVEKEAKAYPRYDGTYPEIGKLIEWVDTFQNLYCIGRNGQHRYNNMDHSVMTGFAAADTICGTTSGKRAIWEVNTDNEYHEDDN